MRTTRSMRPIWHAMHAFRALQHRSVAAAAIVATLGVASPVTAQGPVQATLAVRARVATALTVVAQDELQFGTFVAPFAPRLVRVSDNAAAARRGRFLITGDAGSEVAVELTMPDALRQGATAIALGDWRLRVSAVDADEGGSDHVVQPGANTVTLRLPGAVGTQGTLFVRVGATATPAGAPAAGAYGALVQVAVAYTGA